MSKFTTLILLPLMAITIMLLTGCGKGSEKPTYAVLKINSSPSEAVVSVREKEIGTTPFQQKFHPGTSIVKISKLNYYPAWEKVELRAGEETVLNITLQPVKSAVLLMTTPTNAKVIIDDQVKGVTPLVLRDLAVGDYRARIEKTGYAPREAIWAVKDEQPQEVIINLNSNVGRIELNSTPAHCQVLINNVPSGYTPFKKELEEGKYQFRLEKDGFAPIEESITILRDQNVGKVLKLNQLPGILEVTSDPVGADVFINDQPHGATPLVLKSLPPGKYTIRLEKNSFDQVFKEVVILPGQKSTADFALTKNTGGIDLIVNPPGTTIYINGKSQGTTDKGENKMLSKLFQIRGLNAGKYEITAAHKRAIPDSTTITVLVQKGQIARPKPINLWVANAELKLKNSKAMIGLLYVEGSKITFGPEPGVKLEYDKSEIEYLKPIETGDE